MDIFLENLDDSVSGYRNMIRLWHQLRDCRFNTLDIRMDKVNWLAGNMCSPLGAILYRIGRNRNRVTISHLNSHMRQVLSENGFLKSYGQELVPDTYKTTISYQRFEKTDSRYFASYIDNELSGKGIPEMSQGLRKKILESVYEVFNNAVIHSESDLGIFACGQSYPNKLCLDFTITDLGVGFHTNVTKQTGSDMKPVEAIVWALSDRNTTKTGPVPGGLGLKLLQEFVAKNQGKIQIVSGYGYWEFGIKETITQDFQEDFPGSIVNIQINTADTHSYCLSSEIKPNEIF